MLASAVAIAVFAVWLGLAFFGHRRPRDRAVADSPPGADLPRANGPRLAYRRVGDADHLQVFGLNAPPEQRDH